MSEPPETTTPADRSAGEEGSTANRLRINTEADMEEVVKVLIPAVIGFAGGVVGSIVAPWVQWGIEKRRLRRADRKELIHLCRKELEGVAVPRRTAFMLTTLYSRIKPHLSPVTVEWMAEVDTDGPIGPQPWVDIFVAELASLEKEWELI